MDQESIDVQQKFKQSIVTFLRQAHLLQFVDYLRYLLNIKKNWRDNKIFAKENPGFRLPPSDLSYDAYAHTNGRTYFQTGLEHAQYLSDLIKRHTDRKTLRICEWGCGPGRVIRHMPNLLADRSVELYGFDYNPRTIEWCSANIQNITFQVNALAPPLPCESDSFDCLYCLSVFTHLSQDMHSQWIEELSRVVKPDGLIILTTHGDSTRASLLNNEIHDYDRGKLVVRGNIKEGKRCFVAYHPPAYVKNELLRKLEVIGHFTKVSPTLMQDVWLVKNRKSPSTNRQGSV
jgi:ubiquinone/menaquinone biosynthesis C-methylase UbiE